MDTKFFLLFSFLLFFDPSTSVSTSIGTPSLPSPTIATDTPLSQDTSNYLDTVSIQDVLSSDIDASEKIEKKIINALTQYASNCNTTRKIDLSTEGFSFSENSVTIDLGSENAIFYNLRVFELSPSSYRRKSYSTLIGCDSTKIAKVEIKLPKDIEIHADLKVAKITNSSSGLSLSPTDVLSTGSMTLTLKNNSISKQFSTQADDPNSSTSKISYPKSVVSLDIATKFQMPIYSQLEAFVDKIESSLRQFLIEKLDAELVNNGISVADSCSKSINDKNSKKVNLPFLNNNLNNLYVIPNSKLETWKGVSLSAGPIIIDGLSSFNNTELTILENEVSTPPAAGFYYTTPSYDDPEMKEMIVKIMTNDLKGKLDWSYNSKQRSIPFTLGFIQFEVKKSITYEYTRKDFDEYGNYYGDNRYLRSYRNKITVNLNLGDVQIKSSKSSVCENESEFVNFVLSEYLKTVIADSLKNSLDKKIQNEPKFVNCY